MSDLRRQEFEPFFKSRPVEEIAIHLTAPIERAADHTDVVEFRDQRAHVGICQLLYGTRNTTRHFFRVDGEKQASSKIRNKFQLGGRICGFTKRKDSLACFFTADGTGIC
jgi:hypothetical protein